MRCGCERCCAFIAALRARISASSTAPFRRWRFRCSSFCWWQLDRPQDSAPRFVEGAGVPYGHAELSARSCATRSASPHLARTSNPEDELPESLVTRMILLTRKADFSAAHFYWNDAWSEDENHRVFGKCANRQGHGHNYTLEVTVKGEHRSNFGLCCRPEAAEGHHGARGRLGVRPSPPEL